MSDKVYFVSGGNRGIGFGLVGEFSNLPNTKVITTARDVEKAVELQALAKERGNIHILQYDATSTKAANEVGKEVGQIVDGIDVFIASAAISGGMNTVLEATEGVWTDHYNVNVLAPILLYQQLYPYLIKRNTRKIVFFSSVAGCITNYTPFSVSAYGQSKAALNYTVKELGFELGGEDFIVFSYFPGGVDTAASQAAIAKLKAQNPQLGEMIASSLISPAESAVKLSSILDKVTKEDNGAFLDNTGAQIGW